MAKLGNNSFKKKSITESSNYVAVKTFKYLWVIDLESGNAKSIRRNSFFIKMFDPQPLRGSNPFSIYDYFIHPDHIQHSIKEGEKLIQMFLTNIISLLKEREFLILVAEMDKLLYNSRIMEHQLF